MNLNTVFYLNTVPHVIAKFSCNTPMGHKRAPRFFPLCESHIETLKDSFQTKGHIGWWMGWYGFLKWNYLGIAVKIALHYITYRNSSGSPLHRGKVSWVTQKADSKMSQEKVNFIYRVCYLLLMAPFISLRFYIYRIGEYNTYFSSLCENELK